jgi:hypothetical protein
MDVFNNPVGCQTRPAVFQAKAAVYEERKGLEGCQTRRGCAATAPCAGAGAERSPGKPGFRRLRRKCAQIT